MLLEESKSKAILGFSHDLLDIPNKVSDKAKKRQNIASHRKIRRKALLLADRSGRVKP